MSAPAHGADRGRALESLVLGFAEASPELREIAVLDREGKQLASTDGRNWSASASRLWRAAEAGGEDAGAELRWIHVGTEQGEAFAVRSPAGMAIALTDRFALAGLVLGDLRAALRLLADEKGA